MNSTEKRMLPDEARKMIIDLVNHQADALKVQTAVSEPVQDDSNVVKSLPDEIINSLRSSFHEQGILWVNHITQLGKKLTDFNVGKMMDIYLDVCKHAELTFLSGSYLYLAGHTDASMDKSEIHVYKSMIDTAGGIWLNEMLYPQINAIEQCCLSEILERNYLPFSAWLLVKNVGSSKIEDIPFHLDNKAIGLDKLENKWMYVGFMNSAAFEKMLVALYNMFDNYLKNITLSVDNTEAVKYLCRQVSAKLIAIKGRFTTSSSSEVSNLMSVKRVKGEVIDQIIAKPRMASLDQMPDNPLLWITTMMDYQYQTADLALSELNEFIQKNKINLAEGDSFNRLRVTISLHVLKGLFMILRDMGIVKTSSEAALNRWIAATFSTETTLEPSESAIKQEYNTKTSGSIRYWTETDHSVTSAAQQYYKKLNSAKKD